MHCFEPRASEPSFFAVFSAEARSLVTRTSVMVADWRPGEKRHGSLLWGTPSKRAPPKKKKTTNRGRNLSWTNSVAPRKIHNRLLVWGHDQKWITRRKGRLWQLRRREPQKMCFLSVCLPLSQPYKKNTGKKTKHPIARNSHCCPTLLQGSMLECLAAIEIATRSTASPKLFPLKVRAYTLDRP